MQFATPLDIPPPRPDATVLSPTSPLSAADEYRLIAEVRDGEQATLQLAAGAADCDALKAQAAKGVAARDRLILANLDLVYALVNKLPHTGTHSRDDLAGYAILGLMRAIERFDPELGYRLTTYAGWFIKQAIKRAITSYGRTVRLPAHKVNALYRANKAHQQQTTSLRREPTDVELAATLELSTAELKQLQGQANLTLSLDELRGVDADYSFGAQVADEGATAEYQQVDNRLLVAAAIAVLNPRERMVISRYYGLDGSAETYEDIGHSLDLTRERIRQIITGALVKMRLTLLGHPPPADSHRLPYLTICGRGFVTSDKLLLVEWLQERGFSWDAESGTWWRVLGGEGVRISKSGQVLCLGDDVLKVQELLASHARE